MVINVKYLKHGIKYPRDYLKVFTDTGFKNLPNGGSQGGQILSLTDYKNNTIPLYRNSFKTKRVVGWKTAAETKSLSEGCDVAITIKLLSELWLHRKQLDVMAYTDKSLKHETNLQKRFLVYITG